MKVPMNTGEGSPPLQTDKEIVLIHVESETEPHACLLSTRRMCLGS